MNIKYTDRSRIDLYIAFDWYEKQRAGLGHEFLHSLEDSIEKINHNPNLYPKSHLNFHRYVVRRFTLINHFPILLFYNMLSYVNQSGCKSTCL